MNEQILALKSLLRETPDFQRATEILRSGESVVWDGCVGSAFAFLGATAAESLRKTTLVVVARPGDVDRVAADLAFFTDAPILKYPVLPASVFDDAGEEIFLSEDVDFGVRLRVLKTLDRRATAPFVAETTGGADVKGDATSADSAKRANDANDVTDANSVTGANDATSADAPPFVVASLAALLQPVPSREQVAEGTLRVALNEEFGRDRLVRWLAEGGFHSTTAVELPGEYSARGHVVDVFAVDWDKPVRFEFFGDEVESIRSFDVASQRSVEELESVEISRLLVGGVATGSFVDRLPNDAWTLFCGADEVGETKRMIAEYSDAERSRLAEPLDVVNALYRRPTARAVAVATGEEVASARFDVDFGSVERFQGDATQVEAALNRSPEEESISIVCASEAEERRLRETFRAAVPLREERLHFWVGTLSNGFDWKAANVVLIGAEQLFGRSVARRSTDGARKKALRKTIDSFMELTPGELVIHTERGIARYLGVETIDKANQREDHLKLEFADAAYLYVPASRIGKIQRYVGPGGGRVEPALAKIRGSSWDKQKKAAQEGVWELALEMLEVQAARDSLEGVAFPADGPWQRDFESLFPYRETDDQLAAIEAVKRDMERPRPMDRLLCGDVGFGKTEVALRAAFKAVEAGYQVAILVPTTVLAEQHYRVFSERTAAFPVTVARLSRFVPKKEQKETLEKLKSGAVDIVIGTHRVAQKDVKFRKLGLVVIDEEQKFGVKDKEKLKELRNLVDVLTMTATPIPRTLHLSLVGVRDISNLETPPADRLPVETRVSRFNPETVRKAILRELNRGGQTFYLHNYVADIEEVAARLRKIVPEARVRVGHAQMAAGELEEVMRDFVMRRFDVLVCTTIVESGVDVPNANTIFVDPAHRLGLAELHQIRGRVGREKKQAYCYLMIGANQTLTRDATRRLQAIEEYDRLGSGFHIAMKDLEIRGAGNILGTRQSGHVANVGYEMYCEFLEDAVRALKQEPQKLKVEVEVDLPGTAILPDAYVADSRTKIDFYRRFDRVATIPEAVDVRNELRDRFGPLPAEAERLFVLAQIRIKAFDYRVRKVQLAQYEGLKDGEKTKMLAITFRAPDLMYKLASDLKRIGATLQLVDDEKEAMRGYVKLPRDLFDRNGNPRVDELLEYALKIFDLRDSADDEALKRAEETRRELAENVGKKKMPPQPTKNPLGAALRRLREEGKLPPKNDVNR